MSVLERTREFGVLRSLGLGSSRLVALVLVESLLLTGAGLVVGGAIALPIVGWLGSSGVDMSLFAESLRSYGIGAVVYPRLDPVDVLSPVALAAATALVAALWPALKVARLRPAQALRHA